MRAEVGEEGIGTLEFSDLLLEPRFLYKEKVGGAFEPGSSFLAATWTRDRLISAVFKVGSKKLIGVPSRYASASTTEELALIEGYGQLDSEYGRLRAGLIPIPFGLEGGDAERRLRFPRSQLFQSRFVNLRDQGISYRMLVNDFFSDWAVHNGEGGADLDNETWMTARWGYDDGRNFRMGLSGSAGRTTSKSTDPGGTAAVTETGFLIAAPSRIRIANVFIDWLTEPFRLSLESTAGDTFQNDQVVKFRAAHADLEYHRGQDFSWLARYDVLSPRSDVSSTQVQEYTLGFSWRSRYENSVLYLLGTKQVRQDVPQDTHRGLLVWRITPLTSSFPSSL